MRIRLHNDTTGPMGHALAGSVVDYPIDVALHYLAHGQADAIDPVPARTAQAPAPVERAVMPAPERLGGGWYLLPDGSKVRKSQLPEVR